MRSTLALAVLLATVAVADAQTYTTYGRVGKHTYSFTTYVFPFAGSGGITTVYRSDLSPEELRARIAKWEAFCQPVYTIDNYGVSRASYRYAGCEFGRSE